LNERGIDASADWTRSIIEENMRKTMTVKDWHEKWTGWDDAAKNEDGTLDREMFDRDQPTRMADWKAAQKNTLDMADKSGKKGAEWRQVLRENGINIDDETAAKWKAEAAAEEQKQTGTDKEYIEIEEILAKRNRAGGSISREDAQKIANSKHPAAESYREFLERIDQINL